MVRPSTVQTVHVGSSLAPRRRGQARCCPPTTSFVRSLVQQHNRLQGSMLFERVCLERDTVQSSIIMYACSAYAEQQSLMEGEKREGGNNRVEIGPLNRIFKTQQRSSQRRSVPCPLFFSSRLFSHASRNSLRTISQRERRIHPLFSHRPSRIADCRTVVDQTKGKVDGGRWTVDGVRIGRFSFRVGRRRQGRESYIKCE